ncbi:MAG: BamA/TamA family outer membrane protein, partial [Proteobacteria bacterium]|nr:BamA/TamA family outer membrane protein [Pseudomonadota bacterium]
LNVLENGDLGLAIAVREGNTNRFDGAIGYIPASTDGRDGYVTGLLDLGFRNLFGTGRRLDARWRRIDRLSQDLALRYKEPWLFGLPLSVAGGFGQRKQDSLYVQRTFDVSAELMMTEEFSIGVGVTSASVYPGQLSTPAVTKNGSTGLALFILYDSRDRPVAPTSGAVYQTSYERGSKRIEAGPLVAEAVTETKDRISADVEAYFMILRPHMVAVAAHGREIRTPVIEVSDLYRLGGARSLRGYAEDQFLGSRVVWTNLEYRLLAGNRSYVYAFFDWAYVATVSGEESSLPRSEFRPYGYGAGLLVDTALGIVDVSIAAGKGDTFSTAKFHLRLV